LEIFSKNQKSPENSQKFKKPKNSQKSSCQGQSQQLLPTTPKKKSKNSTNFPNNTKFFPKILKFHKNS
jgi:hypothetical protein